MMLALALVLMAGCETADSGACDLDPFATLQAEVITSTMPADQTFDGTVMVALSGDASACSVEHDLDDESVATLQREGCATANELAYDYSGLVAQPDESEVFVVDGEQSVWLCAYIVGHEPGQEQTFWIQSSAGEIEVTVKVRDDQ